jgi:hypothetical protein
MQGVITHLHECCSSENERASESGMKGERERECASGREWREKGRGSAIHCASEGKVLGGGEVG